jgi:lysophospholipase L1-like esterase
VLRIGREAAFAPLVAFAILAACSVAAPPATTLAPSDAEAADAGLTPKDHSPQSRGAPPLTVPEDAGADTTIDADVAAWHIVGRTDTRDPRGPKLGYSGTEIRARFAGTGLALVVRQERLGHFDVWLDGARASGMTVPSGEAVHEVVSGLPFGAHDVVLVKRTETFVGVTQLLAVVPTDGGTLVPTPAPSRRRIEVIGDSITCGFGVLGSDASCAFSPETEAEPLAWGALAARELGALHTSIAVSGIGVYRNYDGDTAGTMPEVYDRAIADDPSSAWDHSFVPEVIVVNLGTNDFAGGKGDPGPAFRDAYEIFLAHLRALHAEASIVVASSPMLSGTNRLLARDYIDQAIVGRHEAGDRKITLLDLGEQDPADGLGCGYHPSVATQAKMAAKLVNHLRITLGW